MSDTILDYAKIVAGKYMSAKPVGSYIWRELMGEIQFWFTRAAHECAVKVVGYDPYPTAAHMRGAVENTGVLLISDNGLQHPVWSHAENVMFRFVHDYLGHIRGGYNFGMPGELFAYEAMAEYMRPLVRPALFTEVVAQACVKVTTGNFPEQKLVVLKNLPDYNDYLKDENGNKRRAY